MTDREVADKLYEAIEQYVSVKALCDDFGWSGESFKIDIGEGNFVVAEEAMDFVELKVADSMRAYHKEYK